MPRGPYRCHPNIGPPFQRTMPLRARSDRISASVSGLELLYLGRSMDAAEGERWGFFNRVVAAEDLLSAAREMAARIAAGPGFVNMMTKTMLAQEWSMSLQQAIEAEAQAQAICMQGKHFHRVYHAFVAREKPVFEGDCWRTGAFWTGPSSRTATARWRPSLIAGPGVV